MRSPGGTAITHGTGSLHVATCKKVCHNATIWNKDGQKVLYGDLCSCDMEILRQEIDLQNQALLILRESASTTIQRVDNVYRGLCLLAGQASYLIYKGETYVWDPAPLVPLDNYFPIRLSGRLNVPENTFNLDEALRIFEVGLVLDA